MSNAQEPERDQFIWRQGQDQDDLWGGPVISEKPGMLPFERLFAERWPDSLTQKTCFHASVFKQR